MSQAYTFFEKVLKKKSEFCKQKGSQKSLILRVTNKREGERHTWSPIMNLMSKYSILPYKPFLSGISSKLEHLLETYKALLPSFP